LEQDHLCFKSVDDAISALQAEAAPMSLNRFERESSQSIILAVNDSLEATPYAPQPGDHPDARRNPSLNADVEMQYLYRMLIERGHARQVFSGRHHHLELNVTRVEIAGDPAVYGFVRPRPIQPVS
jgi:hypothetical protein